MLETPLIHFNKHKHVKNATAHLNVQARLKAYLLHNIDILVRLTCKHHQTLETNYKHQYKLF